MEMNIKTIQLEEFDLTLMELRILNHGQALKIERSLAVFGQLQPVVARYCEGGYQLIDGFKRFYAAEILLMTGLECLVLEVSLAQAKILVMSYNRSRKTMGFWEEALILQDLRKHHGMDQKQLARLTGRSRSWVSRRLSLVEKIDPEVAADIRLGELSGSHGRALMKLPRGKQSAVADTILRWGLSTRQSEQVVAAWLKAEDEQRERILEHPDIALREPEVWDEQDLYVRDERLSSLGNELRLYIGQITVQAGGMIRLLTDERIDRLSESERIILQPALQRALACCRELIETRQDLSHQNKIQEHEE